MLGDLARLGDTVYCFVSNPSPAKLSARLDTPAAVAMANDLLMDKKSGWKLERASDQCLGCDYLGEHRACQHPDSGSIMLSGRVLQSGVRCDLRNVSSR